MGNWNLECGLKEVIRDEIRSHLRIETEWIGDPSTSTFGIQINLSWDNCLFRTTVVDFIGKTID